MKQYKHKNMGNFLSNKTEIEFWHSRTSKTAMHRSKGTILMCGNVCEIEGFACEIDDGNESGGLNFEQYEVVSIERFTKKNIYIDRIKGVENLAVALQNNKETISEFSKSFKLLLPCDQPDVGKITVLDEYKQELAIFYLNY